MECLFQIGYCNGKDIQEIKRDIPTMTVMHTDYSTKTVTVLNTIQGERAEKLYEELTNLYG